VPKGAISLHVSQFDASARAQALACLLDPLQEPRVVLSRNW